MVQRQGGTWYSNEVLKRLKDGSIKAPFEAEVAFFPYEKGTKPQLVIATNGWSVFGNQKDTNRIAAAKEFVKFFMSAPEPVKSFLKASGSLPPQKDLDLYSDNPDLSKQLNRMKGWLKYSAYLGNERPYWSQIRAAFYPEIQAAFTGAKTAQQALDDFAKKANEIVAQNEK